MTRTLLLAVFLFSSASLFAAPTTQPDLPVKIQVDASKKLGTLRPIWRFFGADEPNYATMKDGRKLLGDLGRLSPKNVYFRTHNLLCTGDGTAAIKWGSTNIYTEDESGKPVYDWKIIDELFDTYLQNGVRPYVQIGFMPKALSIKPEPYQHHWSPGADYKTILGGWAYPPKDYDKWRELCKQWTLHCIERYGKQEVEQWYWELWNEPNILYWQGTEQEYHKLYDYTVDGVRAALPTARVGGPEIAGGGSRGGIKFQRDFLEHCLRGTNYATGKTGTPIDFIAFHAKGSPKLVDGHVRMGISNQLNDIDKGFATVAEFPELKNTPIVIGESDPDGCAACAAQFYPQNGYRNGPLYAAYTAASFARKQDLADKHGINFLGALTWAFEFEDQPYFAGFRVLATNGIPLPVLNTFRMYSKMDGDRISAESSASVPLATMLRDGVRGAPDVSALASVSDRKICAMVWNYHDDDVAGPSAAVELSFAGIPADVESAKMAQYRIDEEHSNPYQVWKKLGSPKEPTREQYAELMNASELATMGEEQTVAVKETGAIVKFTLPRQGVNLIVLQW
jgi:xylan 1,4-beta-xylosidase